MADRENMSVEEILAAARRADGGEGGAAPSGESPATSEPAAAEEAPKKSAAESKPQTPAKPGAQSTADILAAARAADANGDAGGEAEEAPQEAAAETKEAKDEPATQGAAGKSAKEMSVAEMLAAARAEKSGGAKKEGATATKEKPAAAKAKPKPAAKAKSPAAEAKKPSGPKDTASILAAARKADKSGPMSKAEAAALKQPAAEAKPKPKKQAPPMPEKPAYARPEPARPRREDEETRRGFFGVFLGSYLAFGFTSLGLTHLLWGLGFARFMFPNILTEPPTTFKVGPPSGIAPGMVETKFKAQFGVWVVNAIYNGARIIFALKSVCTHLGCTPNWLEAEQKFKCPCHGSGFYKDGINFEGPAPRPLERYAISVADDGQLQVDKSKTFQEEKGQWTDPESFVSV